MAAMWMMGCCNTRMATWTGMIAGLAVLLLATRVAAQPLPHDLMAPPSIADGIELIGVVGEDDRRLSAFPYVANVGGGPNSLASGVAIGRRYLITAAHLFVRRGKWMATRSDRRPVGWEWGAYRVYIEGCPGRVYGIANVFVNTLNPEAHRKLDYAVVQLDQPHCGPSVAVWSMNQTEVDRILFGKGTDRAPRMVTAVGYYGSYTVEHFDQSAVLDTGTFEGLRHDMILAWQYAAEGRVIDENEDYLFANDTDNPQHLLVHQIDSAIGGSGGPLLIHDGDENYVIGIHIGERRDNAEINFAIQISDGFLDLIAEHVPDAVIRQEPE
jgi:Trypsin